MSTFYNRTRIATSIPRKLLYEGHPHLIPLYYLLRTSELAREGMDNSGSFRFADHIYAARPSGRYGIGRVLDAVLLRMKSARALRARYVFAMKELRPLVRDAHDSGRRMDVLAVPCGLARELFELADGFEAERPADVQFHGLDLDEGLIMNVKQMSRGHVNLSFHVGDALSDTDYPGTFDVILSTGLTEFLTDEEVIRFYRTAYKRLNPGGTFITSGLSRHAPSDYLLRTMAELHTHYRTEAELRGLAFAAGLWDVDAYQDSTCLQTMIIARKGKDAVPLGAARNDPSTINPDIRYDDPCLTPVRAAEPPFSLGTPRSRGRARPAGPARSRP